MKPYIFICFCVLITGLTGGYTFSNNVSLSIDNLHERSSLHLQIAWDDSWKLEGSPSNHDALWLFVKYREKNSPWKHMYLSDDPADFESGDSITVKTADDKAGVFVKRSEYGTGNIPLQNLIIPFDSELPHREYDFRVFAISMVYVPDGPFYAGDGVSINSFADGSDGKPFYIDHNEAITVGPEAGSLYGLDDDPPADDIPASYPVGYESFYVMKQPITQEQYKDFLNMLTYAQQEARTASAPSAPEGTAALAGEVHQNRNNIAVAEPGSDNDRPAVYELIDENHVFGSPDDGRHRACNFLNWADVAAYLSWSGLRPMTALEYEKAARGPLQPLPGEFAWGTEHVINARSVLNDGSGTEQVSEIADDSSGLALHGYDGVRGALRSGFAGPGVSGRLETGSGYYGAFDLSGNVWDMVVVTNETGLNFKGTHGNGMLTANGEADINDWPGTDGYGAGYRGGGWNSGIYEPGNFRDLAVSDRFYGFSPPDVRLNTTGGRGVRSY